VEEIGGSKKLVADGQGGGGSRDVLDRVGRVFGRGPVVAVQADVAARRRVDDQHRSGARAGGWSCVLGRDDKIVGLGRRGVRLVRKRRCES
jgi:hypothetical protein